MRLIKSLEDPTSRGNTRNSQRNYAQKAKGLPLTSYTMDGRSRGDQLPSISFKQEDAEGVHFLHCDTLVVRAVVASNGLKRMLANNGKDVNILFRATFDKIIVDHELTPITTPLYNFIDNSIIPRGKIPLAVEMEKSTQSH